MKLSSLLLLLTCQVAARAQSGVTLTTLHSFNGLDGGHPNGTVVQVENGDFYGTTGEGGDYNLGTVFKMTADGTLTTLYSFTGPDGAYPQGPALAQDANGNFYGTTADGGMDFDGRSSSGRGTIFRVTSDGTLTRLYSFSGPDGDGPYGGLVQDNGHDFYGTTVGGGDQDVGTLFKLTLDGSLTTLVSFNGTNGAYPPSGLVQGTDGNLYGTTESGGVYTNQSGFGASALYSVSTSPALTRRKSFRRANPAARSR